MGADLGSRADRNRSHTVPPSHLNPGGIGTEVIAIVILMVLFKRRGWLGSGPTV
jgi:hypothetical protein